MYQNVYILLKSCVSWLYIIPYARVCSKCFTFDLESKNDPCPHSTTQPPTHSPSVHMHTHLNSWFHFKPSKKNSREKEREFVCVCVFFFYWNTNQKQKRINLEHEDKKKCICVLVVVVVVVENFENMNERINNL